MRRIYHRNTHRKKIRQDAMLVLRQTRRLIDPVLLDNARAVIAESLLKQQPVQESDVSVDKKKNILTVMKYLALNSGHKDVHRKVQAILSEGL